MRSGSWRRTEEAAADVKGAPPWERRFFQNDVHIGAAKAKGTDGSAAHFASAREGNQLVVENEGAVCELHSGIGRLEMQRGRNCLVMQDQGGLDETRDSSGIGGVPNVSLDGADVQNCFLSVLRSKTFLSASNSMGSPTGVPVPCASM